MSIGADQTSINLPRHPSQLYEAFFEGIVLFVIMWFVFRKKELVKGVRTGIYMIGYGVFRFFIEYVREPDIGIGFPLRFSDAENPTYLLVTPWNFTTGQILNFLMILGGVSLILIVNARQKRTR
jgi:phosphatidylglycerol:prolipoprotein diacylglycerol transferase